MNGGETDRSPRSNERAQGGRANAPHGNGGDHRSSPESSGEAVGDSQSPERGERLGLGLGSSERERGRGWLGWAGPV
jgi:hypothetical protein